MATLYKVVWKNVKICATVKKQLNRNCFTRFLSSEGFRLIGSNDFGIVVTYDFTSSLPVTFGVAKRCF